MVDDNVFFGLAWQRGHPPPQAHGARPSRRGASGVGNGALCAEVVRRATGFRSRGGEVRAAEALAAAGMASVAAR